MGNINTFRGYGPEQGYAFLREAILQHDYLSRGIKLSADEIFVSDGAKSDVANFQELFSPLETVALQNPVYPVYLDTNVMAGRTEEFSNAGWFICRVPREIILRRPCRISPLIWFICVPPITPREPL